MIAAAAAMTLRTPLPAPVRESDMVMPGEPIPPPPDSAPDFVEDFTEDPDPCRWVPHYLPHWTVPQRSRARYAITPDGIELRIESDQLD